MIGARPLCGVDDLDNLPVPKRPCPGDEHGLVVATLVDVPQSLLEFRVCRLSRGGV